MGNHLEDLLKCLSEFGINFEKKGNDRTFIYEAEFIDKTKPKIKIIPVKPKDIPLLIQNHMIDCVICYSDIITNYPCDVKNLVIFQSKKTQIVVIGNQDYERQSEKIIILSEYVHLTSQWVHSNQLNAKVLQINGSAESYLVNGLCDLCTVVTETGTTIKTNNLKIIDILLENTLGLYIHVDKYDLLKDIFGAPKGEEYRTYYAFKQKK